MKWIFLFSILVVSLALPACSNAECDGYTNKWAYSDILALDPADTSQASADILAVYWRDLTQNPRPTLLSRLFPYLQDDQRAQLRLDFLDVPIHPDADIYIALDHKTGGKKKLPLNTSALVEWDTLIKLQASGQVQIVNDRGSPQLDFGLQVWRDPLMDTLTLSFNPEAHSQVKSHGYKGEIFTTLPESRSVQDRSGPFSTGDTPPARARVLFTFWNVFPAYTPAQTLRRWDGAHTGPLGGRHGLYNLLRTARNQAIPLVLLDLKSPTSLSAMDYGEGLEIVRDMTDSGSLVLPEWLPSVALPIDLQARIMAENRQIGKNFGLPDGKFIVAPLSENFPSSYKIVFEPVITSQGAPNTGHNPVKPIRWADRIVIPLPGDLPTDQATLSGPSPQVKRALIENALDNTKMNSKAEILILGGDLPQSTWGEPQRARATFEYLRAHPWIEFMDTNALLSLRPELGEIPFQGEAQPNPREVEIIAGLLDAPSNQLSSAALDAYLALHAPFSPSSPDLAALRDKYLGVVAMLLAASEWESDPYTGIDCSNDLDMDNEPECTLASDEILAIIEPVDGSLVFAFARTETGVHQLIGPSSQFVVGTSDPSTWDLSAGMQADPGVIPGAFTDEMAPYQLIQRGDLLAFQNEGNVKSYILTPNGMRFEYQTVTPKTWQIPIAIDPWMRFHPGWAEGYQVFNKNNGFELMAGSGVKLEIEASSELSHHSFKVTQDRMGRQENPNYEYPPGHYLPFPMHLLELEATGDGFIQLKIYE